MDAQVIKVCSQGLNLSHLGKPISDLRDHFHYLEEDFGFNVCGEGGEYETAVFDCPLFKTHKIISMEQNVIMHDKNPNCPVAYLHYSKFELQEKSHKEKAKS